MIRLVKILLATIATIWLLGTAIGLCALAISAPPCRATWVTAAVLWPVFVVAPTQVTEPIVGWAEGWCR